MAHRQLRYHQAKLDGTSFDPLMAPPKLFGYHVCHRKILKISFPSDINVNGKESVVEYRGEPYNRWTKVTIFCCDGGTCVNSIHLGLQGGHPSAPAGERVEAVGGQSLGGLPGLQRSPTTGWLIPV